MKHNIYYETLDIVCFIGYRDAIKVQYMFKTWIEGCLARRWVCQKSRN